MKCAQELYENGHITYMRTDKMKYSKEFIVIVKDFIKKEYDEKYINASIDGLAINLENKEEAHEAIRPIKIDNDLINNEEISNDSKKLYKIIKQRTLESCMEKSKIQYMNLEILTEEKYIFKLRVENILFLGWRVVRTPKDECKNELYEYYNNLKNNSIIKLNGLFSEIHLKDGAQHFTEAQLVKQLEKMGIGRPSTYSSLIDKIQERGYVEKKDIPGKICEFTNIQLINDNIEKKPETKEMGSEKKKLIITSVGKLVMEFLINNYNELFYYEYTKEMEDKLDKITSGDMNGLEVCQSVNKCITDLIGNSNFVKEKMIIDDCHEIVLGKYGHVIKKTDDEKVSFIEIPKDIEINEILKGNVNISEIIRKKQENVSIETKYGMVSIKKGKFGYYFINKNETISLKEWDDESIKDIKREDLELRVEENNNKKKTRILSKDMSIRESKYGKYIYFKNEKMKKPQFLKLNNFKGEIDEASNKDILTWINKTYDLTI